jgi:Tol biopolymer transport system component
MKADGSQVTQLTKGETQEYFHDWSSDGYIYFSSYAGAPTAQQNNPWFWNYADIWRLKPILPD